MELLHRWSDDINDYNGLNKKIINSKCFKYKASITGSTIYYNVAVKVTNAYGNEVDNPEYDANKIGTKKVEIAVPLKYLSSFWRTLNMPLINCEVSLTLTWSENCVINSMEKRVTTGIKKDNSPTNATFQITDRKLYVPIVTLSTENDKILLGQLRTGSKRIIKWNKHRSEMTNQAENKNLNYLIDPTFTKVNILFVLSFENEHDRTSFSKYYVTSVQIKDFNVLIDGKSLFDKPIKTGVETYEKIIEMGRNNDYTTKIYWIISTF